MTQQFKAHPAPTACWIPLPGEFTVGLRTLAPGSVQCSLLVSGALHTLKLTKAHTHTHKF